MTRLSASPPALRNRTAGRIIFKLSAREERELREMEAARNKSRRYARQSRGSRWDRMRARLDANLVLFAEASRWRGFTSTDPVTTPSATRKIGLLARKNKAVFERDNFTCRDCYQQFDHPEPYQGEPIPGLTRGHIIPDSMGGTAAINNLIAQCVPCNSALGNQVWNPNILTVPEWDNLATEPAE